MKKPPVSATGPWRAMAAFGAAAECAGCRDRLGLRDCYQVWVPRRQIPDGRFSYCQSCAERNDYSNSSKIKNQKRNG